MITCPRCHADNWEGTAYCHVCSALLVSLGACAANPSMGSASPSTRRLGESPRTNTKPLPTKQAFLSRPKGAIFGDAFLFQSLVYSDEKQHNYLVTQLAKGDQARIRVCSNPECGAYVPPRSTEVEKFCIDCGAALSDNVGEMILVETLHPFPNNLAEIVKKNLSHRSIRPPLALFDEKVSGVQRYCMVIPYISMEGNHMEPSIVLQNGVDLAQGLEYLHLNGVAFDGFIDVNCFGRANGRIVWANFSRTVLKASLGREERSQDTRALAQQLYLWLGGKAKYTPLASLSAAVNSVFEQALSSPGFESAHSFAQALLEALGAQEVQPLVYDFRLGRRTDVGMVRSLNEDSLLTIERTQISRSEAQPLGFYVVADGMGGHSAGEVASGTIVKVLSHEAMKGLFAEETMATAAERKTWLVEAVKKANQAVFELRQSAGSDMGSTLVAAVVEANRAIIAHVGDSRAYLLSRKGIQRLTTDHSLVERLIATHQISPEEARYHPQRNVIYRTIGDKLQVEVETSEHLLEKDDYLLLCSDGLSGMIDDAAIHRIVMEANSPQEACDRLIKAANDAGGEDNITAILVQLVSIER